MQNTKSFVKNTEEEDNLCKFITKNISAFGTTNIRDSCIYTIDSYQSKSPSLAASVESLSVAPLTGYKNPKSGQHFARRRRRWWWHSITDTKCWLSIALFLILAANISLLGMKIIDGARDDNIAVLIEKLQREHSTVTTYVASVQMDIKNLTELQQQSLLVNYTLEKMHSDMEKVRTFHYTGILFMRYF